MIIERIHLSGFGRLRDFGAEFTPGLNVVYGPNEAGKSTLMNALLALLYGHFEDSAQWNRSAAERLRRFQPWHTEQYGGVLLVRLANDDRYRIERCFNKDHTKIYQEPGAGDVTSQYTPGQHGWISFADEHLGLSPAEFRACACVTQEGLSLARDELDALHRRLATFADSAGTERSAQEAIKNLERIRRDRLNLETRLIDRNPLRRVQRRIQELRAEALQSQSALDDAAAMFARTQGLRDQATQLREELQQLDRAIGHHEIAEIEGRIERLNTLDRQIACLDDELAKLADVAELSEEAFTRAYVAARDVTRLSSALAEITSRVDAERDERARAEAELERILAELAKLPAAASASASVVRVAEQTVRDWLAASEAADEASQAVAQLQNRCQELKATLPPGLESVPATTKVRDLVEAIVRADGSAERLASDEKQAAKLNIPVDVIREHDTLQKALDGLTAERLSELREKEQELRLSEPVQTGLSIATRLWIAFLAGVAGFVIGLVSRGATSALVGGLILAAFAFLITIIIKQRSRQQTDLILEKHRAIRTGLFGRYGVTTLEDLQRKWDRLAELNQQVAEAVRLQKAVEASRALHERHVARIVELCGTSDPAEAEHRLHLLRQKATIDAELTKASAALKEATVQSRAADDALEQRRMAAVSALAKLPLEVDNPHQASQALDELRDLQNQRAELLHEQTRVTAALATFRERVQQRDQLAEELAAAQTIARDAMVVLGADPNAVDLAEAKAQRQVLFRSYQRASSERNVQVNLRSQLLADGDPTIWRQQLEALRARVDGMMVDDPRELAELRARRDAAGEELRELEAEVASLSARLSERLQRLREPAEIIEELAMAEREFGQLQRLASAVDDARKLLTEVAEEHRRSFAPRLGAAIAERLARVTDGRYENAEVDPTDLTVRIQSDEYGNLVTLDRLSHGTRDAITLLLRASIVELLSRSDEPVPLLLDDVLVHVDAERTTRAIATLTELAVDRQLFYFTQDFRIASLAGSFGKVKVHQLAAP